MQSVPVTHATGHRTLTTCMAKKKGRARFPTSLLEHHTALAPLTFGVPAGIRCIVTLECTEARKMGKTPSRYTTQKVR